MSNAAATHNAVLASPRISNPHRISSAGIAGFSAVGTTRIAAAINGNIGSSAIMDHTYSHVARLAGSIFFTHTDCTNIQMYQKNPVTRLHTRTMAQ